MGLFGPSKPKQITKKEMDLVKRHLYGKLDKKEWADVEQLFHGDLHEEGVLHKGIDSSEAQRGIGWLRDNMKKHHLEHDDIDLLESHFEKHLKD